MAAPADQGARVQPSIFSGATVKSVTEAGGPAGKTRPDLIRDVDPTTARVGERLCLRKWRRECEPGDRAGA